MTVYPESISDTTNRINSWSPEGDVLTLVTTHDEPMKIHLNQMKPAVDLLFSDLTAALAELFPGGMDFPKKVQWELEDSLGTPIAFVDQPGFEKVISPLYTHFITKMSSPDEPTHQIFSGNTFQAPKFKEWMDLEQKALEKIFLIILFTGGGVSPRTFSISALQFKETSTKRNLYLHNGVLCFAWPKAKINSRSGSGGSHSLYSFPPQLNWPLFIYLGIIRKFAVHIIERQMWSLGQLQTSLFVYTGVGINRGSPWEASHMNTILGHFSQSLFNSPIRVSDFRQITQSIYFQHFQRRKEMTDIMEDVANRMGNHSGDVANRYYPGNDSTSAKDPELSLQVIELCIACSRAWHCWLGLISYDDMIGSSLGPLPILQKHHNKVVSQLKAGDWLFRNKGKILPQKNIHDLLTRVFSAVRLTSCFQSWSLIPSFIRKQKNTNYYA